MSRPVLVIAVFAILLSVFATPSVAQDYALSRLEASPRHHEWVSVPSGERAVQAFVAYPERADAATAVIVIHENRGLTDWVRSFADQLAEQGYLAIAPDLLSSFDETHARTSDFESSDAARDALYRLDADQITTDLKAVRSYITGLPSANGTVAVAGFCWGGSQSFRFATNETGLSAVMVFYGSPPSDAEDLRRVTAPVYGFYGENDNRINASIEPTVEVMTELKRAYDPVIYVGAGHAYMRQGDDPEASDAVKQARDASWVRIQSILNRLTP